MSDPIRNAAGVPEPSPANTAAGADVARQALVALRKLRAQLDAIEAARSEPLAIVGLGCRLPGAPDPDAFWDLLQRGGDAVRPIPPERWDVERFTHPDPASDLHVVHQAGLIDQVDRFDAEFFGIAGREAQLMDPQQRLLLEVVWEALEQAGIPPASLQGSRTGVFVGTTTTDYLNLIYARLGDAELDAYVVSGNTLNATAGRVAYVLGLQGPTIAMDTACSSSLVAFDRACRSVRDGECRMAIAAGVNLIIGPEILVSLARWGMLSPDGRCKTFDASANGFVRAEGCGVVLVKRLSHAIADGDRICALVRGSAVNQDGRSSGFAVPNGLAQVGVIRDALAASGLDASRIGYVEAHGTGTTLGDPIEMEALTTVYGAGRDAARPLVVGAVKSNVGHLEAAAGITGLIKTVLALQHRQIPPNVHFERPSPHIPWARIPVRIPVALEDWQPIEGRRLAGISSFGFSGTNAHVILEEAPAPAARELPAPHGPQLVTLSARSPAALRALAGRYAEALEGAAPSQAEAIGLAASGGRSHLPHRLAVVGTGAAELAARLRAVRDTADAAADGPGIWRGHAPGQDGPGVVYLFTGQGAQYAGMGRSLAASSPVFRAALERCAAVMDPLLPRPLLEVMFEAAPATAEGRAVLALNQTRYTQPALFAIEWALAELWRSRGVTPALVLGHSVGEFAAAACAGVLSLEDAARLVTQRGALMQALPAGGAMAAVFTSEARVAAQLAGMGGRGADRLAIAGLNATDEVIVSGEQVALQALCAALQAEGVRCEPLPVSHAFHSPLMQPMLAAFEQAARACVRSTPKLPVISTATGLAADAQWGTADYWVRQLQSPVRYASAIREALNGRGIGIALEIGPHPVLAGLGRRNVDDPGLAWLPSLRRERDDESTLKASLAALYVRGAAHDWSGHEGAAWRSRISLPAYPFQRTRLWIDARDDGSVRPGRHAAAGTRPVDAHVLLGRPLPLAGEERIFQTEAGQPGHALLRQHRLHGRSLWPATASIEMLLAAARETQGPGPLLLEELALLAPLALVDAQTVTVQTVRRADGRVELCRTDPAAPSGWSCFARAQLRREAVPADDPGDFEAGHARCRHEIDPTAFYAAMARRGAQFGPAFHSLVQIRQGDGESLGRVRLADDEAGADRGTPALNGCLLHPVLMDGVLQLVSVAAGDIDGADPRLLVPVGFERAVWQRASGRALRGHVRLRPTTRGGPVIADIAVRDDDGLLLARVDGMRFERATARELGIVEADLLDTSTYAFDWRPLDTPSKPAPSAAPGRWLLLSDRSGVADALAPALRALGATVQVMPPATTGTAHDAWLAVLRGGSPALGGLPTQVVHLAALDLTDEAAPDRGVATLRPALESALQLAQAAAGRAATAPLRLWLLTRSTQTARAGDAVAPLGAALWGLGRVLRSEHAALAASLLDVGPTIDVAALAQLLCHADLRESQLALRGDAASVLRLARSRPRASGGPAFRWTAPRPGSLDDLVAEAFVPLPPGPGEVRIEVRAAGLNFRDVLWALGMVPGVGDLLGGECAGVVEAVGPGVQGLAVGDEVIAVAPGSLGTRVNVAQHFVARKPAALGFDEAAALPVAYGTALYGLERLAGLQRGERVLIHAATGGVGLAAVHLARSLGAEVFATAGSEAKRALLHDLGVEHVFDSRSLAFREQILAATGGRGVDVVLNSLAGDFIAAGLQLLGPGGRFLEMGKRGIWTRDAVSARHPGVRYLPFDLVDDGRRDAGLLPDLFARLQAGLASGALKPLPVSRYALEQAQDALRKMMQARHVGKLVLLSPAHAGAPVDAPLPRPLRGDATYLVSGGLGALGLAVAEGLVARGARQLLLLGRRAPDVAVARALARLGEGGATLRTAAVDVADGVALQAVLDDAAQTLPPLRGVIHAAGVLDDGLLAQQDWARFETVLAPKLQGALQLDALTRANELDFFVMFSAGAAWLGAAGQANYASANAALDALAEARRQAGRPGLSIAWGRWAGAGMAAGRDERDWDALGVAAIAVDPGLQALFGLLPQTAGAVAVMPMDWDRYLGRSYPGGAPACFDELRPPTVGTGPSASGLVAELQSTPVDQRADLLLRRLETIVRRVVGVPAAQAIEPERPLRELGMDSLMTVELRNAIGRAFERTLPATLVFDHPSLAALTTFLLAGMPGPQPLPAGDPVAAAGAPRAALLQGIQALSEQEAEAELLRELMGKVPS